ncbi:MAG: pyrroline-5-carboxylate reductase [Planctomycetota bacterium]
MATLGFIGAGNMATALCRGVVGAGLVPGDEVLAGDPDAARRAAFEEATGARTTPDNPEACRAERLVLAVKPQVMPTVLAELGPLLGADRLVISIAAGIPAAQIEAACEAPVRVVRAMPNTPMLVGAGAAALCKGAHATDADLARAAELFAACGLVLEVDNEEQIHAVTALSGSGPAYVFLLAELMARAGEELGLAGADAVALANQTVLGAGRMLAESAEPAAELRRRVTSPGGTTEAALRSMNENHVLESVVQAIHRACRRSQELADGEG